MGAWIEMSVFTQAELAYLFGERRLARIATVGGNGTPHVAPVGWRFNSDLGVIEVGGRALERTKKYRDVSSTGRAAIVIDDVLPPWHPRGIEIRGRAEAIAHPMALIRIHPERIVSWGIETDTIGIRSARTIPFHGEAQDV
jgi:pyridoxamine 5'-phosphate oxidase family protein